MSRLLSERFRYDPDAVFRGPLTEDQRECVRQLLRNVEDGKYVLTNDPCPCGTAADSFKVSEVDRIGLRFNFVLCETCGTVRIDPYLDQPSLTDFYKHHYQRMYGRATDVIDYFRRQRVKLGRLVATYGNILAKSDVILEIGCGAGGGVGLFQDLGYQAWGCDYDQELIEFGRSQGVGNLFLGSARDILRENPQARFDFIYMHHVFEHVIDPLRMLMDVARLLTPRGRALIVVPDISRIGESSWPAGDALQFFHLAHKYNYTRVGLRRIGKQINLFMRVIRPAYFRPVSRCPEIWVEYSRVVHTSPAVELDSYESGRELYGYLQRTEQTFQRAQHNDKRTVAAPPNTAREASQLEITIPCPPPVS